MLPANFYQAVKSLSLTSGGAQLLLIRATLFAHAGLSHKRITSSAHLVQSSVTRRYSSQHHLAMFKTPHNSQVNLNKTCIQGNQLNYFGSHLHPLSLSSNSKIALNSDGKSLKVSKLYKWL